MSLKICIFIPPKCEMFLDMGASNPPISYKLMNLNKKGPEIKPISSPNVVFFNARGQRNPKII